MLARGTIRVILSFSRSFYESSVPREVSLADGNDLLTFSEAAKLLKVKRTRMYAMLQSGELSATKVGKLWRVSRAAIEEYLSR